MATARQRLIVKAVTDLVPRAPFLDAEAIRAAARARHMRGLRPEAAVWLATIAHIRHQHTDYDALMDEGYERDAARFFVVEDTNGVLDAWGAARRLDPEVDEPSAEDAQGYGADEVTDGDDEETDED
ncbi:DUF2293 domain-containing protein [Fulvimarina sp. 2208YS6-2-32]|uniref:DUF2293 domain-containing protein n=1 Tax=Fulvimarina uroteuthidis TaxID=3098149 RepID=A0ABU5I599_9HYPH|nr:DUF2293 domain-containing protein [Fulvimarina sp. 2208YS6-2-32]MDY8109974.1 DUF2293 domain-containing protein [Fulvimarina sp. 2208YS6-2-32]